MSSKTKIDPKDEYYLRGMIRVGFLNFNIKDKRVKTWLSKGLITIERVGNGTNNRNHLIPTSKLKELLK